MPASAARPLEPRHQPGQRRAGPRRSASARSARSRPGCPRRPGPARCRGSRRPPGTGWCPSRCRPATAWPAPTSKGSGHAAAALPRRDQIGRRDHRHRTVLPVGVALVDVADRDVLVEAALQRLAEVGLREHLPRRPSGCCSSGRSNGCSTRPAAPACSCRPAGCPRLGSGRRSSRRRSSAAGSRPGRVPSRSICELLLVGERRHLAELVEVRLVRARVVLVGHERDDAFQGVAPAAATAR